MHKPLIVCFFLSDKISPLQYGIFNSGKVWKTNKRTKTSEEMESTRLRNDGFHKNYIGMVERGERNISLKNIEMLAKVFKLSISKLLEV